MFSHFWAEKPTPLSRLKKYQLIFSSVPLPLNVSEPTTRDVLSFLLDGHVFNDLCDHLFGPLWPVEPTSHVQQVPCWLEEAEGTQKGAGELAEALNEFLSPSGAFCTILSQLSPPPLDFITGVQTRWKEGSSTEGAAEEDHQFIRPQWLPLTLVCHYTWELTGNTADTDLTSLTTDNIPSSLLIPCWRPPMVNKDVSSAGAPGRAAVCAPTSIYPYFLFRMMLYFRYRAGKQSPSLVTLPNTIRPLDGDASHWDQAKYYFKVMDRKVTQLISPSQLKPFPTRFPLFDRIFDAHIKYHLTPQATMPFTSGMSYYDLQWGPAEVTTAFLLHTPLHVWLNTEAEPATELLRTPYERPAALAALLFTAPQLEALWRAVCQRQLSSRSNRDFFRGGSLLNNGGAAGGGSAGGNQLAVQSITDSKEFLYRHILRMMRQILISIPIFPICPMEHFASVLSLWEALLTVELQANPDQADVLPKRYEAASILLRDFLRLAKSMDFAGKATVPALQGFHRVLTALNGRDTGMHNFLRQVSASIESNPTARELQLIRSKLVLTWSDKEAHSAMHGGQVPLASIGLLSAISRDVAIDAVSVYHSSQHRLELLSKAGIVNDEVQALGDINQGLERLFPDLTALSQNQKNLDRRSAETGAAAPVANGPRGTTHAAGAHSGSLGQHKILTEEERRAYLHGESVTCGPPGLSHVRFRRAPEPANRPIASDEIPILVVMSKYLDIVANWIYQRFVAPCPHQPTCNAGHALVVTPVQYRGMGCSQPQCRGKERPAVWFCEQCECFYGAECKGPLVELMTGQLLTSRGGRALKEDTCRYCNTLLTTSDLQLEVAAGFTICDVCAMRKKTVTTRWMASYNAVWVMILVFLIYCYIAVFW